VRWPSHRAAEVRSFERDSGPQADNGGAEMAVRGLDMPGRVTVDGQVLETGRDQVPFLSADCTQSGSDGLVWARRGGGLAPPPFFPYYYFPSNLQSGLRSA